MEVLVYGLLVLAPALGARLPRQYIDGELYTSHLSTQKSANTIAQDESIFRDSGNPESVDPSIDNLSFDALKSESDLPSNTLSLAFEDGSLVEVGSNIPSAPALEEGLELDSLVNPSVIKSTEGEVVCSADEVLHVDGTCVTPIIRRNIFTFAEPITPPTTTEPPILPPPVVNYDIVFIKSPEPTNTEPIIIPPPQHKTLVYLLSKKSPAGPNFIEVPSEHQSNPEVYFVNYNGATGQVDLGRPNSDIILPTGDHLSNVLSTNFLQSGRSSAAAQNPVQETLSTSLDNTLGSQHLLSTNFLQSVGSTAATQNPIEGALSTSPDLTISNQHLFNTNFLQPFGSTTGIQNPILGALSIPSEHTISNQHLMNANFLQPVGSTAGAQNPIQGALSTSLDHTFSNQHLLNNNFVQSVGSTSATQNPSQGALSTFVDIRIDNQNDITPINNSNLPTFELIDNSSVNNIDLPKFEMVQHFGTASTDEILRQFGLDMSNINSLRRSLSL